MTASQIPAPDHEIDRKPQHRPMQQGAVAFEEVIPRPGQLDAALHIEDVQGQPQLHVILGLEIELPDLSLAIPRGTASLPGAPPRLPNESTFRSGETTKAFAIFGSVKSIFPS